MKEYNPEDHMKPLCALVEHNCVPELYVITKGQDVFYSEYLPNVDGEIVMPELNFDFVVLRANGNCGNFFVVNVVYDEDDESFLMSSLVQAVDEDEAKDIVDRARELGYLVTDADVLSVHKCDGNDFLRINNVLVGACFKDGCQTNVRFSTFFGGDGGRIIFGDGGTAEQHDYAYMFTEGPIPVQLWPSDKYLFGSELETYNAVKHGDSKQ